MTFVSRALADLAVLLFFSAVLGAQPLASDPSFSGSLDVQEAEVEVLVTADAGRVLRAVVPWTAGVPPAS
jgi:hypothetical protein